MNQFASLVEDTDLSPLTCNNDYYVEDPLTHQPWLEDFSPESDQMQTSSSTKSGSSSESEYEPETQGIRKRIQKKARQTGSKNLKFCNQDKFVNK